MRGWWTQCNWVTLVFGGHREDVVKPERDVKAVSQKLIILEGSAEEQFSRKRYPTILVRCYSFVSRILFKSYVHLMFRLLIFFVLILVIWRDHQQTETF